MFAATRKTFSIAPTFNSFDHTGANTDNEIASIASLLPITGRILKSSVFFAGDGATVVARNAVWRGIDGDIASMSPQFTAPSGTEVTGGQSLNTSTHVPGMVVSAKDSVFVGFWRAPAGTGVWSIDTTAGTWNFKTDLSGDIGNFASQSVCAGPFTCGNIQCSVDMVGGDMKRNGRAYPCFSRGHRTGRR